MPKLRFKRQSGTTFNAASCSLAHVQAAVDLTSAGDTVTIPAGTCTWAAPLSVTKGISIIGAGEGVTIIEHGFNGTLLDIDIPSATSTFRLSSLSLEPGDGANGQPALGNITGTSSESTCSHIRMDHLSFTGWNTPTNFTGFLFYADNVVGVIDHNTISLGSGGGIFMGMGLSSYGGVGSNGDNSWAQPNSYGSDNALYFEDNTVTSPNGMALTDTNIGGGARFVVRFNDLTNVSIQTHGTESTGRTRGGRQYEVYGNDLTITPAAQGDLIGWRSGTGLVFRNTKYDTGQYNSLASLTNYRDGKSFSPWGNCNGEGPYDDNAGVVYDSGTVTSSSSTSPLLVTDTGQSWSVNQWVANPPYSIVNMSRTDGTGAHPGAQITANTSNNISSSNYGAFDGGASAVDFEVGDSYQILRALAGIDQCGRGGNGAAYLSGATPSPTGWVDQPLDPIYEWGDTIDGGGTPVFGWVTSSHTTRFAANVDYYSQISPFTGATGTGLGVLASRPATCTPGVGYWATDQGSWNTSGNGFGQGKLYVCTATDTWTERYTPYAYPHPLAI